MSLHLLVPQKSSFMAPRLDTVHIMLVEDDPDVREVTCDLLAEEGAQVTSFDAAEPALAALHAPRVRFDLLFTDVVLGGPLTGFDLAAAARARCPGLPIVFATGFTGPAGAVPPDLAAIAPLLLKPFRRIELLGAIATALPRLRVA